MIRTFWILFVNIFLLSYSLSSFCLPQGFVYLRAIDPSIHQEMRYASTMNFVGRVIKGYEKPECILTLSAAKTLHQIQTELRKTNLSLKVYDCYRPVSAVQDFYDWSQDPTDQKMKLFFYPYVSKSNLFKLGYISKRSSHSSGSTVDLTLIQYIKQPSLIVLRNKLLSLGKKNISAYKLYELNMGTTYDFMDSNSHTFNRSHINQKSYRNRILLRAIMIKHGFFPYNKEWWHFTLQKEPFRNRYFDFPVE